jgi:hypothetical protein
MKIETEDGIVELWQDASYSFSGWSKAIVTIAVGDA